MPKKKFEIKPIPNRLPPPAIPKRERPEVAELDEHDKEMLFMEMLLQSGLAIEQYAGGTPEDPKRKRVVAAVDITDNKGNLLFKKGAILYFRDIEAISKAYERGDILNEPKMKKSPEIPMTSEEKVPVPEPERKS